MESQVPHPVGRHYDEGAHDAGLHAVIEGEGHHDEKPSVIKKVKAKAKKIKDTLKKHSPGHGHDHDHDLDRVPGHDGEGYSEEEDEEMEEGPEVHGAPIYESKEPRAAKYGSDKGRSPIGNLERPPVMEEDRYDHDRPRSEFTDPPPRPFGQWEQEKRNETNIGGSTGMVKDPNSPTMGGQAHPSNYETKVTNPSGTGGREVEINPLLKSLDKMSLRDEGQAKPRLEREEEVYTGSHDQFAPEVLPKSHDPNKPEELHRVKLTKNPGQQSSYTEKLTSTAAAVADKAVAAKDAIASKLGYSGQTENVASRDSAEKSATPAGYTSKVTSAVTGTLAPVYEKVVDAGSAVISKVQGSGPEHKVEGTVEAKRGTEMDRGPDMGVSVKEYFVEKFRPGDEDKALSETITSVFHRGKDEMGVVKKEEEPEKPLGKVTESEEVKARLGTGEGDAAVGHLVAEKGVVDRLKGAVSSWIGKGSEAQKSQAAMGTSVVTDEGLSGLQGEQAENGNSAEGFQAAVH